MGLGYGSAKLVISRGAQNRSWVEELKMGFG